MKYGEQHKGNIPSKQAKAVTEWALTRFNELTEQWENAIHKRKIKKID